MRSWSVRLMLLLTLLGTELAGLCHGRIIPSLEVIQVHEEEAELPLPSPSPPSKGYGVLTMAEKAPPGDAPRRHYYSSRRVQEEDHGVSASKRVVPEGPNPLHN
ncbi:uncharacterized protein LOC121053854 [Oryza brachyantha]|uniref:Uncharacterized protein n=1 Tax=Oryza brachyantha TaxID=4533 RepID=J3LJ62_ORYBR|nr:uncharacterized protein LOC121053854 [Oryza brachyantha]